MIKTNDIYYRVDSEIVENGFWNTDINGKKELIEEGLKKYIISKILELKPNFNILDNNDKKLIVEDYLDILSKLIPERKQSEVLSPFIHYILNVMGNLQNHSIIWSQEDDEYLIESPVITLKNGILDDLKTHQKTNYLKLFSGIYNIFKNEFLLKEHSSKIKLK